MVPRWARWTVIVPANMHHLIKSQFNIILPLSGRIFPSYLRNESVLSLSDLPHAWCISPPISFVPITLILFDKGDKSWNSSLHNLFHPVTTSSLDSNIHLCPNFWLHITVKNKTKRRQRAIVRSKSNILLSNWNVRKPGILSKGYLTPTSRENGLLYGYDHTYKNQHRLVIQLIKKFIACLKQERSSLDFGSL
jgi:hypothetical protein